MSRLVNICSSSFCLVIHPKKTGDQVVAPLWKQIREIRMFFWGWWGSKRNFQKQSFRLTKLSFHNQTIDRLLNQIPFPEKMCNASKIYMRGTLCSRPNSFLFDLTASASPILMRSGNIRKGFQPKLSNLVTRQKDSGLYKSEVSLSIFQWYWKGRFCAERPHE